jgi:hypothetical protein
MPSAGIAWLPTWAVRRDRSVGRRWARYPQVLRTNNPAAGQIAHDQARAMHVSEVPWS